MVVFNLGGYWATTLLGKAQKLLWRVIELFFSQKTPTHTLVSFHTLNGMLHVHAIRTCWCSSSCILCGVRVILVHCYMSWIGLYSGWKTSTTQACCNARWGWLCYGPDQRQKAYSSAPLRGSERGFFTRDLLSRKYNQTLQYHHPTTLDTLPFPWPSLTQKNQETNTYSNASIFQII